jgi:hypothetical protein
MISRAAAEIVRAAVTAVLAALLAPMGSMAPRRMLTLSALMGLLIPGFAAHADAGWRGHPEYRPRPDWRAAALWAGTGAYYTGYAVPAYGYRSPSYYGYAGAYPGWGYSYVTMTPWRFSTCSYPGYGYGSAAFAWCRY